MVALGRRWSAFLDQQHRKPDGLFGYLIGEQMHHQHTPETDWSMKLLQIQPGDRVLEIGFGAGRGLELSLKQARQGHVTGIDLSPTMISAARQRNRQALADRRLTLLCGDLAHLPFGSGQFQRIVTIHTFYFWPDPAHICQDLINLLSRQGRLVAIFATAKADQDGRMVYWPIQQQAEALVEKLQQQPGIEAQLVYGPNSRQYNNVALMIDKQ